MRPGVSVDTTARTWHGNESIDDLLVPLDALRPHPRNPRRGNVALIAASLDRFGQQRPVLALPDGTVVAGNHTLLAMIELGWTHGAVVRSDLTDSEVEGYLLADNRTGDLAAYDDFVLTELLEPFYASGTLAGLGYTEDDVEALRELIGTLGAPQLDDPARLDQLGRSIPAGREFVLVYADELADEFVDCATEIARRHDTNALADTVMVAMRLARGA